MQTNRKANNIINVIRLADSIKALISFIWRKVAQEASARIERWERKCWTHRGRYARRLNKCIPTVRASQPASQYKPPDWLARVAQGVHFVCLLLHPLSRRAALNCDRPASAFWSNDQHPARRWAHLVDPLGFGAATCCCWASSERHQTACVFGAPPPERSYQPAWLSSGRILAINLEQRPGSSLQGALGQSGPTLKPFREETTTPPSSCRLNDSVRFT